MARSAARLKMGYYPLPPIEAQNIRSVLNFPGPCSVIDPCAGKGTALNLITAGVPALRFGVELDSARAEEAAKTGIRMIQGNVFDTHAKVESFSLLYLNPPYDSEINLTGNRRLERLFLEHTHHWLVQHGVLVFAIPFEQLSDCAGILSANFTRISAFRMADAESVRFPRLWCSVCAGMSGVPRTRKASGGYGCSPSTEDMRGCLNLLQERSSRMPCPSPAKRR